MNAYFHPHPDYWDRGAQAAPCPPKIDVLARLLHASEYQLDHAPLETRLGSHADVAQLQAAGPLLNPRAYQHNFHTLAYPVCPPELSAVPATGRIIRSGDEVPCDGIWEPVTVERSKWLGVVPVGKGRLQNNGCFNYLLCGLEAPKIRRGRHWAVRTRWRLRWEDTRYVDGVIPDESEYFLAPRQGAASHCESALQARSGDHCPMSGEWRTDESGGATLRVEAGAVMPDMFATNARGELTVRWAMWRMECQA